MARQDFEREIDELAGEYEAGSRGILGMILRYIGARLGIVEAEAGIDEITTVMKQTTTEWIERVVPQAYADGVNEAGRVLGVEDAGSRGNPEAHEAALDILINDLAAECAQATDRMSEDAKSTLRDIARRQVTDMMNEGVNAIKQAPEMEEEMRERDVKFTDKAGRRWQPRAYSRMLLRTHLIKVSNTGNLNAAASMGSPGVRVSDGGPGDVDEPCLRANGQRWSMVVAAANLLEHPNCRRAFAPLPPSYTGPFDRE